MCGIVNYRWFRRNSCFSQISFACKVGSKNNIPRRANRNFLYLFAFLVIPAKKNIIIEFRIWQILQSLAHGIMQIPLIINWLNRSQIYTICNIISKFLPPCVKNQVVICSFGNLRHPYSVCGKPAKELIASATDRFQLKALCRREINMILVLAIVY